MIKPVRRNKRLKWIDSHYAKALIINAIFGGITKAYYVHIAHEMRDMCNDVERISDLKMLNEDVCNIESFDCVVKGSVTKCR